MEEEEPKSPSLPEDSPLYEYSIGIEENVLGFQQLIDEFSEALELDENFDEMTAESYDEKKSYIESKLSELSVLHNLLADQFGDLIEEVSNKCPALMQNLHLESSGSTSPQVTQTLAPRYSTTTGYDLLLQPDGGGFYLSKAQSGSESSKSPVKKPAVPSVSDDAKDPEALLNISNLEEEVASLKQKVESLTLENGELKKEIQENIADVELYMSKSVPEYKKMEEGFHKSREIVKKLDEHMSGVVVKQLAAEKKHESDMKEMNTKMNEYMTEISQLKDTHEKKEKIWNGVTDKLKQVLKERSEIVDQLSEQMNILCADKSSQNTRIHQLKTELNSAKSKHKRVLLLFDNLQKLINELKLKVVELEREVERQGKALSNRD